MLITYRLSHDSFTICLPEVDAKRGAEQHYRAILLSDAERAS